MMNGMKEIEQIRELVETNFYTSKQASEYLGVNLSRLTNLVRQGMIERYKIDSLALYSRKELSEYKAKRGNKKGGRYPKSEG